METGQETTVTIIGFAGALTAILMWVLSYFAPAFFMAAPPGAEAAVVGARVGAVVQRPRRPDPRPVRGIFHDIVGGKD